jgi:hypothetical protein
MDRNIPRQPENSRVIGIIPTRASDVLAHTGLVPAIAINAKSAFRAKLDECGELLLRESASKNEPWRKRLEALKIEVRAHFEKHPADLPIRAEGQFYYIDLTQRENQRVISKKSSAFDALKKSMGIKALVEALTFPFKLLDQHVCAVDQSAFVTQARTGSRDLSAVLIVPKAA